MEKEIWIVWAKTEQHDFYREWIYLVEADSADEAKELIKHFHCRSKSIRLRTVKVKFSEHRRDQRVCHFTQIGEAGYFYFAGAVEDGV